MEKAIIAGIAAIIGGTITGLFSWLSSKTKTSSRARQKFRKDILDRVGKLEKEQKVLEQVVMTWKGRYWSLYSWLVNFCRHHDMDTYPPKFHEMEFEDLNKTEIDEKNN